MRIDEPSPAWRVDLFGGLEASRGATRLSKFRTRKTASLFAYLAFFHDRPHSREVLTDMFWPEANFDAGRQSLRMALSALREALDAGSATGSHLEADRITVRLMNVTTDVEDFESGISQEGDVTTLMQALRTVKGPLLKGFDDHWIVAQWLRIEEAYAQAAVRMMDLSLEQGAVKSAIVAGKEAVALLGPREDLHLALVRLYAADGQPSLAIAQFEDLERQLDEQWGETPSESAYKVLASIPRSTRPATPAKVRPALPARTSSFLGREAETEAALDLLDKFQVRLITLVGPGGSGKTALAREIAARASASFEGRVWMVELADLSRPDRIWDSVSERVSGPTDRRATAESVAESLGGDPCLLVLDNCEHLLPDGAIKVKAILEAAPSLRVMATSRMTLNLAGENVFQVPPLPVPPVSARPADLYSIPSVALFAERACATSPGFRLGPENARAVAEICRRLEGLPLAIELAAAKTLTHSPAQILAKLGTSLDFLVSRKRDVSGRHRSLRAALDWSLGLLEDGLRETFFETGVFRGGWTVEAGAAVSGSKSFEDDLARLVEASLVLNDLTGEHPRFRLLEPVREYALDGLSPERSAAVRRRHFDYYFGLVCGEANGSPSASNRAWLDALHRDHENLCAAFEGVWDGIIPPQEAVDLVKRARDMFRPRGHTAVWRTYLFQLRELVKDSKDAHLQASLLCEVARLSSNALDGDTVRDLFTQALEWAEKADDLELLGAAHTGAAGTFTYVAEYERSVEHYEKAVEAYQAIGDAKGLAGTIRQMAMAYVSMGDHEKSYETLQRALPYAREAGEPDSLAWILTDLAVEHALHGFVDESESCFAEAHRLCEDTHNLHMRSIVYWQQAEAELRTGRSQGSVVTHRRCVRCALDAEFKEGLKWMLVSFGCALEAAGSSELALRTIARVTKWRTDENRQFTGDEHEILDPARERLQASLGAMFDKSWEAAERADLDALVEDLLAV